MTPWIVAAIALTGLFGLTTWSVLRGSTLDRLIGLQLVGVVLPLLFVVVSVASGRALYLDVAVVLAIVSFAGGLTYAHVLERWL